MGRRELCEAREDGCKSLAQSKWWLVQNPGGGTLTRGSRPRVCRSSLHFSKPREPRQVQLLPGTAPAGMDGRALSPGPSGSSCYGDGAGGERWGRAGGSDKARLHSWGRVGRRWKDWEARRRGEGPSATWAGLPPRRPPFRLQPALWARTPEAAGSGSARAETRDVHALGAGADRGAAGADARGNWLWEGLRVGGVSGSRA